MVMIQKHQSQTAKTPTSFSINNTKEDRLVSGMNPIHVRHVNQFRIHMERRGILYKAYTSGSTASMQVQGF